MKRTVNRLSILLTMTLLLIMLPLCPPAQAEPMPVLAPAAKAVKAENQVVNGDFESGSLNGWDSWQGTDVSEDAAASGDYGAHLKGNGDWGGMLRQDVPVKKGTTYVISFWAKVNTVGSNLLFLGASTNTHYPPAVGSNDLWISNTSWKKLTYIVTPTDDNKMAINFSGGGTGAAESVYVDDVVMYEEGQEPEEPDQPPAEPLTLLSMGVLNNRPITESKNLIDNSSFESSASAQWAVDTFLSNNVTVVRDETTPDGEQSLFFNTSHIAEPEWHYFWIDVEKNTNYTFSAWLKGSFLSAHNAGRATVGVIDPHSKKFLTMPEKNQDIAGSMFSANTRQMVPTAWDARWHLRSVTFNTEDKTTVGIALYGHGSELWVDGMALFKVGDGVKYTDKRNVDSISPAYEADPILCTPENSLTENPSLDDLTSTFWQSGNGWRNGFMSIAESTYEYGNSLRYKQSDNPCGVHYIRWIEVQPHTQYVFSINVKILQSGDGRLALYDGKLRGCTAFIDIPFDAEDFGTEWFPLRFTFNSGAYSRIGIAVEDRGGEALLDNIRVFEAADGFEGEDPFIPVAKNGWVREGAKWTYYEKGEQVKAKWIKDGAWYYIGADGYMVANKWIKDSKGWCYLTESGKMATNAWVKDSVGWCYVGDNGYCVTNCWKKDSHGWCYLNASGSMVKNNWIHDGTGWYFLNADGYMVSNTWKKDSKGWCYLTDSGKMATNAWIKDSVGWCYVDGSGYCVTNTWKKDSKGWVYLDQSGRMVTNKWVKDSVGWCYVDSSGYCVTNTWKKDSKGWCYLDQNGRMTVSAWVQDGDEWYYLDHNGYMVAGKSLTIGGKTYTFGKNGALL